MQSSGRRKDLRKAARFYAVSKDPHNTDLRFDSSIFLIISAILIFSK